MMFDAKVTSIPGIYEIFPRIISDNRGQFVKTFHNRIFREMGLETDYAEEYYSRSIHGVLRGMHFQLPPHEHAKLVYCIEGEVLDVVLDIRVGSPSYGLHQTFCLNSATGNMIYMPPGVAHGFYVTGSCATMVYKVTSVYSPEHDTGIHWDTAGIDWPDRYPIVSQKDAELLPFSLFTSPFCYVEQNL